MQLEPKSASGCGLASLSAPESKPDWARFVGNIIPKALPLGWSTARDLGLDGNARYCLLAGDIGNDYPLVVGKSYDKIETVGVTTAGIFVWATFIVLLAAIALDPGSAPAAADGSDR